MLKMNNDCYETVAKFLPDEDLRSMTQVCKEFKPVFADDRFYTPPANELRSAWTAVRNEPQNHPNGLQAYERIQKFHQFVCKQPPPFNALTTSRSEDPELYSLLESRFSFAGAPKFVTDLVCSYPHNIPVLSLNAQMGGTGYIDFLEPADLSTPVMRGTDHFGRLFLSVKGTFHFSHGAEETVVHTLFQRFPNMDLWVTGKAGLPLFLSEDCTTIENAHSFRQQLQVLLSNGETSFPGPNGDTEHRMTLG